MGRTAENGQETNAANAGGTGASPANEAPYRQLIDVSFGEDVAVYAFANLYGCRIDSHSRVGAFVEIQAGVRVGRACKIQSHAVICTGVRISDEVFVGHGAIFINDKYPRATNGDGVLQTEEDWEMLKTVVEQGASIGSGAIILGGLRIGAGSVVGAGAVVTRDVEPGTTVVGNPARVLQRSPA